MELWFSDYQTEKVKVSVKVQKQLFGLQTEFQRIDVFDSDANILAYISIGDRIQDIERLVGALADIKRLYAKDPEKMPGAEYIRPTVLVSPQTAFYAEKKAVPIRNPSLQAYDPEVFPLPASPAASPKQMQEQLPFLPVPTH